MKQRIEFIDLAKGFCILLVVWTHVASYYKVNYPLKEMFSMFRMPLYFFLSGMFFKSYSGLFEFVIRKTNKLLVPFFFFFMAISCMVPLFYNAVAKEPMLFEPRFWAKLYFNGAIWFLLALFITNILFYSIFFLSQKGKYPTSVLILLSTVLGCLGFFLGENNIQLPLYLDSSLTVLPFFAAGFCIRKYTDLLLPNKYDKYLIPCTLLSFLLTYLFAYSGVVYKLNHFDGSALPTYFCGLMGTLGVLFLSKSIKSVRYISYVGRYSIMILVTHQFLMFLVRPEMIVGGADSVKILNCIIEFVIIMVSYLAIIPFMIKYLPYVTAQKDLFKVPTPKV